MAAARAKLFLAAALAALTLTPPLPALAMHEAVPRIDLGAPLCLQEGGDQPVKHASGSGLFLQRDPSGYEDSVNLYAGFANNAVNERDPTGRCLGLDDEECVAKLQSLGQRVLDAAQQLRESGVVEGYKRYAASQPQHASDYLEAFVASQPSLLQRKVSKQQLDAANPLGRALDRSGDVEEAAAKGDVAGLVEAALHQRDAASQAAEIVATTVLALESGSTSSIERPRRAPGGRGRLSMAKGGELSKLKGSGSLSGGSGGGSTTFFHGTTQKGAAAILQDGLKPVSRSTRPYPSGSFFAHEASTPNALQGASAWPLVQGKTVSSGVSVVEMTVPNATLSTLQSLGLVKKGFPAGLLGFPEETVFLPDALDLLNRSATFRRIPPSF